MNDRQWLHSLALNDYMIDGKLLPSGERLIAIAERLPISYYLWCEGKYAGDCTDLVVAIALAQDVASERRATVMISNEGTDPDRDDLVQTYRKGARAVTVYVDGRVELGQ
jgi:hypothetical protein